MLEEILNNTYYASGIILVSQLTFLYLRTLNVIYTTQLRMLPAIITGNGIGFTWLISMSIGANSIFNGDILPIIAFALGGSVGTYLGIKKESRPGPGQ